jgi:hypothetical protein
MDLDYIDEMNKELHPFYTKFDHHVKPLMTVEQFRTLQNTFLEDIPLNVIQQLGKMYCEYY